MVLIPAIYEIILMRGLVKWNKRKQKKAAKKSQPRGEELGNTCSGFQDAQTELPCKAVDHDDGNNPALNGSSIVLVPKPIAQETIETKAQNTQKLGQEQKEQEKQQEEECEMTVVEKTQELDQEQREQEKQQDDVAEAQKNQELQQQREQQEEEGDSTLGLLGEDRCEVKVVWKVLGEHAQAQEGFSLSRSVSNVEVEIGSLSSGSESG